MPSSEISTHEAAVYVVLRNNPSEWLTVKQVTERSEMLSLPQERTVRSHLKRFAGLGIAEEVKVFPGHRFRLHPQAEEKNAAYVERLRKAVEVFQSK
jgi:hypothetical protein